MTLIHPSSGDGGGQDLLGIGYEGIFLRERKTIILAISDLDPAGDAIAEELGRQAGTLPVSDDDYRVENSVDASRNPHATARRAAHLIQELPRFGQHRNRSNHDRWGVASAPFRSSGPRLSSAAWHSSSILPQIDVRQVSKAAESMLGAVRLMRRMTEGRF